MCDDRAKWTVRRAYQDGKRVELERLQARPATYADYATHLRRWEEYWTAPDRTDAPMSVDQVRRRHLEEWREWLSTTLSGRNVPLNVNKHLRSLHAILAWCERQEAIERAPSIERLPAEAAADKHYFTYAELDRLYDACVAVTWPQVDRAGQQLARPAAEHWQALLVLFFHYGFRTQEIVQYEPDHTSLPWSQIVWDEETPAQDGHARNQCGWLWYVPQKQRRSKPHPLILPLNAVVRAHLVRIQPADNCGNRPVFDWPLSADRLYDTWDELCRRAKVRPKKNLMTGEQPKYHLRHFRKTCTTWLNRHRPGIAPLVTGHAQRELTTNVKADSALSAVVADGSLSRVSAQHYDNQELAVQEALLTLPQPSRFAAIL